MHVCMYVSLYCINQTNFVHIFVCATLTSSCPVNAQRIITSRNHLKVSSAWTFSSDKFAFWAAVKRFAMNICHFTCNATVLKLWNLTCTAIRGWLMVFCSAVADFSLMNAVHTHSQSNAIRKWNNTMELVRWNSTKIKNVLSRGLDDWLCDGSFRAVPHFISLGRCLLQCSNVLFFSVSIFSLICQRSYAIPVLSTNLLLSVSNVKTNNCCRIPLKTNWFSFQLDFLFAQQSTLYMRMWLFRVGVDTTKTNEIQSEKWRTILYLFICWKILLQLVMFFGFYSFSMLFRHIKHRACLFVPFFTQQSQTFMYIAWNINQACTLFCHMYDAHTQIERESTRAISWICTFLCYCSLHWFHYFFLPFY